MLKKIINTFFIRLASTLVSFPLLILTTQYLGAHGRGEVSLLLASVGIMILLNGFIGGTSLVYLLPKNNNRVFFKQVIVLSYCWTIISCIGITLILYFSKTIPPYLLKHILILGILSSVFNTSIIILLSKENIYAFNILGLIQVLINLTIFGTIILIQKSATVQIYISSLYISYLACCCIVFVLLFNEIGKIEIEGSGTDLFSTVKEVSKYGFIAQLGNLIQYLNYRFSYYILNLYIGPADVGVYSVGIVLSEAIWIIAGSLALVQYSRIANVGDTPYAKDLTVALSKLSFIITLFIVLIVLLIPEGMITFIFGKEFSQVKNVIITLSIGISAFGFTIILSHYFSGIGKYHINTIASFLGLIITVLGNILFTPIYGYYGAGITASLSFITTSIFLIYCFKKYSGFGISSFKPRKEDFDTIVRELENIRKK